MVSLLGDDSDASEYDLDIEMKRQKLREQEFEKKKKEKLTELKPSICGPIWIDNKEDSRPKIILEQLSKILIPLRAVCLTGSCSVHTSFSLPTSSRSGKNPIELSVCNFICFY